jgi:hypothetical protein
MREFYQRKSGLNGAGTHMIAGGVLIGFGVIALTMTASGGAQIGLGVMLMFVGHWAKNNPMLRFHEDHVEMKFAALAPRKQLLYREIDEVIEESPKKVFLRVNGKRIRLPIVAFEEHERDEVLQLLRRCAAGDAPRSPSASPLLSRPL